MTLVSFAVLFFVGMMGFALELHAAKQSSVKESRSKCIRPNDSEESLNLCSL